MQQRRDPQRAKRVGDRKGEQVPAPDRIVRSWTVIGEPKGQPRPRAFARKVGNEWTARVYNPDTADKWKHDIAYAIGEAPTAITGPVGVRIDLFFPRPKSLQTMRLITTMVRHTAKPDADNAAKTVLDALTELGWWCDDSQVCELVVTKWYAHPEQPSGARIFVEELAQ